MRVLYRLVTVLSRLTYRPPMHITSSLSSEAVRRDGLRTEETDVRARTSRQSLPPYRRTAFEIQQSIQRNKTVRRSLRQRYVGDERTGLMAAQWLRRPEAKARRCLSSAPIDCHGSFLRGYRKRVTRTASCR
ncbi:MAG: hypothetical protein QOJ15_8127 [Bradyrhizobium sp.]|jgi:hypothetical protein|nr:hypothetical protein [Bradyrhizobium sp.]